MKIASFAASPILAQTLVPERWVMGVSPQTRLGRLYYIATGHFLNKDGKTYDYVSSEVEFETHAAAEKHAFWMEKELNS